MKIRHAWSVIIAWGLCGATQAAEPGQPAVDVLERGLHHKVAASTLSIERNGTTVTRVSKQITLASGLHYRTANGSLAESDPVIEPHINGAIGHQAQITAEWAANLNTYGAVRFTDGDGKTYISHVLGLAFTDAQTGDSVFVAEIQNSNGQIVGKNTVIYPGALGGIADVVFTYERDRVSQDVRIFEALPARPEDFGMVPASTRVETISELVSWPDASITTEILASETDPLLRQAMAVPDFLNQTMEFGSVRLPRGRAYDFQGVVDGNIPVGTTIESSGARRFLIEATPYSSLAPALNALPRKQARQDPPLRMANIKRAAGQRIPRAFPAAPTQAKAGLPQPMRQMAQLKIPKSGVLLDYSLELSGGLTNWFFTPEASHVVRGQVNLYGVTRIGASVVKFAAASTGASLNFNGGVVCETAPYRPCVFTSLNDDSIGTQVSEGALSGYFGAAAMRASTTVTGELHDLRFLYANTGIDWPGSERFYNLQFVSCSNAIRRFSATNAPVHNVMIRGTANGFIGTNASISAQHLTFEGVSTIARLAGTPSTLTLTNSILADVASLGTGTITADYIGYSDSATIPSVAHSWIALPLFGDPVAAGWLYLDPLSNVRGVGTTNIAATLRAELAKSTVDPPTYLTSTIRTDLILAPMAQRDSGPNLTLGYHYPPLDHIVSGLQISTNATLYLTNGVAVGVDYGTSEWGIIFDSGKLISIGSPLAPNRLVRAHCVQELSTGNPGAMAQLYDKGDDGLSHGSSEARFRFTEFSAMSEDGYWLYVGKHFTNFEVSHCWTYNPVLVFNANGGGQTIGLTNNVFEYGSASYMRTSSSSQFHFRNNLFYLHVLDLLQGNTNWSFRDNLVDSSIIYTNGTKISNSHTAYYNVISSYQLPGGATNIILTNLTYEIGPLSRFYQPTNSAITNKGSRTADLAQLYHFTTAATNHVPETNSIVDIGPHWVALDSNGQPLDSDSDGWPNYYEDWDGDGSVDSGETDWQNASDLGLKVIITRPAKNSVIP